MSSTRIQVHPLLLQVSRTQHTSSHSALFFLSNPGVLCAVRPAPPPPSTSFRPSYRQTPQTRYSSNMVKAKGMKTGSTRTVRPRSVPIIFCCGSCKTVNTADCVPISRGQSMSHSTPSYLAFTIHFMRDGEMATNGVLMANLSPSFAPSSSRTHHPLRLLIPSETRRLARPRLFPYLNPVQELSESRQLIHQRSPQVVIALRYLRWLT